MRTLNLCLIVASAALAVLVLANARAEAATITGQNGYTASLYGNPFDPNNDGVGTGTEATAITAGSIGGGSVVVEVPIAGVVSQRDTRGEGNSGTGRIRSDDPDGAGPLTPATSGYMKIVAAAPFTAGTVIAQQSAPSYFFAGLDYNLLLDGNSIQSRTTASNTQPIVVTSLGTMSTVQTLQLNMSMKPATGRGSSTFGAMNEVLILPDSFHEVSATASTPDATQFGEVVTNLNNHSGLTGWFSSSATASATLTFSGTKTIQALVMSSYENTPVSFDIYNDANLKVASGSLAGDGLGDFVGVHFLTPVTTSSLKFVLTGGNATGFTEIIPFELPEPTSMGLVLVGGALMALKRRRAR
jgi:hypothetical protein